jgi:hypothetical protein
VTLVTIFADQHLDGFDRPRRKRGGHDEHAVPGRVERVHFVFYRLDLAHERAVGEIAFCIAQGHGDR